MGPTSPPLRQRGLAEATLLSECLSGDQAHSSARTASAGDEKLLQGSGSISYIETRLAVRVTLTPVQSAASTAAPVSWSVRQ